MAGDWIPMRLDLRDDPAVISMAEEIGCEEDLIVGYLHRIWSWASQQSVDGRIQRIKLSTLNRLFKAEFVQAMARSGWLIEAETGIELPNFDRWMGQSAKTRLNAARRKQKERVTQMSHERVTNVTEFCDKNVTTEEKRREEKNITPTHSSSENPSVNSRLTPLVAYEALHSDDVRKLWDRWMDFVFRQLGRYMDSFQQEHKIAQLLRLQEPKAIEWLEFTWEKQATKGLCDPDDRFGRHKGGQRTPKLPSGPLQI